MLKVGILGLGFIGRVHLATLRKLRGARVVAVCDVEPERRAGRWRAPGAKDYEQAELGGARVYAAAEELFADPGVDVVSINLPTYLHAEYTIAALKAEKHVICEKPMARTSTECSRMIAAARRSGKRLFIAHCIRFWPAYAKAREIVHSGIQGDVVSACFCRRGALPLWSWQGWLQDPVKSGLCGLDLHIHDADFVQHLLGMPRSVQSVAGGFSDGRIDHIITSYEYGPNQLITAEGAWEYAPGYPFAMTFSIALETATLDLTRDLKLMLYPVEGKAREIKTEEGDGYEHELRHFLRCIEADRESDIAPAASAMASLRLIEAEFESARTGARVKCNG
ncbi:MAG: Gfo/Idh/MocA family oxidoreductase [Candidatus Hydrogenedentes bacterium]|nr:Gfo/Idh/MocA family oxidoreductase [Candidatus Hydrogenedentota bacterium]